MSVSRLKSIHIIIIGCVISAIIAGALYYFVVKESYKRLAALDGRMTKAQAVVDQKPAAEKALLAAELEFKQVSAKYSKYEREKMAPVTFEDRTLGMIAQWKEQGEVLGPMVEKYLDKAGIQNTANISVSAASVNPNSFNTYMIRLPVGSVTVTGSFNEIMEHPKIWRKFGRLVQIDGFGLSGQSPNMTASYSITVIQFPRGGTGPAVTMASGGSTGGAAGGMMMGGMMPTMPGMGGMSTMPPGGAGVVK